MLKGSERDIANTWYGEMTLSERVSPSQGATSDNNNPVCLPISSLPRPGPPSLRVAMRGCQSSLTATGDGWYRHWYMCDETSSPSEPIPCPVHYAVSVHCHMSLVSNSLGYRSHLFFVLTECLLNRNNDVNKTKFNHFRNAGLWPPLFPSPAFFHTQDTSHHRSQRTWPVTLAPALTARPPLSRPRPHHLRSPASWPPSWRTRSAAAAATRRTLQWRCPASSQNTAVSTKPCVLCEV